MSEERHKGNRLVAAAGILEEAVVEAGAVGEEVVDLAGLHVVGEAGDEEREDAVPLRVRARRVHVVGVHRRRARREAVGEAHSRRAAEEDAGSAVGTALAAGLRASLPPSRAPGCLRFTAARLRLLLQRREGPDEPVDLRFGTRRLILEGEIQEPNAATAHGIVAIFSSL